MWLRFKFFYLLPLTACENDECWVSLGSVTVLERALLRRDVAGESWLLGWA